MSGALVALTSQKPLPISFSGSFAATAVAGTANSPSNTASVSPGNSGDIRIDTFVDVGAITNSRYNYNSGGLTPLTDPTTINVANGASLIIQTNGDGPGEARTYTITDVTTGRVIETFTHTGA